jgi:hypothetical protein
VSFDLCWQLVGPVAGQEQSLPCKNQLRLPTELTLADCNVDVTGADAQIQPWGMMSMPVTRMLRQSTRIPGLSAGALPKIVALKGIKP